MTDWQHRVAEFARRYSLLHGLVIHALDLVSEVGEVAKEVLLGTDYGLRALQSRPQLADELAEACGVDASDALDAAPERYEHRRTERGKAGSI